VHLERGLSLRAAAVGLPVGHRPPADPIGRRWGGPRSRFIADPRPPFALGVVRPEDSGVLLRARLTALDALFSLAHPPARGPSTPPAAAWCRRRTRRRRRRRTIGGRWSGVCSAPPKAPAPERCCTPRGTRPANKPPRAATGAASSTACGPTRPRCGAPCRRP